MDIFRDIPVIIPSLEPDDRLIHVADSLLETGFKTLVVIDDGSGENYRSYFDELVKRGCVVLRHAVNLGKGRALKDAFNYCLLAYPDMLGCITIDADGQHTARNALELANALVEHPGCLIMGCRDFSSDSVPFKNKWGNRITVGMFKIFCGVACSDTQTGLRAIPTPLMRVLMSVYGERFEFESYMLVEAKRGGFGFYEVPIETIYQGEKYTTHFNPFRDSLRIYGMFLKYIGSSLFSTIIDLGIFTMLVKLLEAIMPRTYIAAATIIARIVSCCVNYTMNMKAVFHSHAKGTLPKYALLSAGIMLCSALGTTYLHRWLDLGELWTKLIVDALLFIASFFLQREFVFKEKKTAEELITTK